MQINRATYRSGNYDSRPHGRPGDGPLIQGITLHTTEGRWPTDAEWLCNPKSRVSCHYVVAPGGQVYQLVDDGQRAWHAGHVWGNDHTIGIEISYRQGQGGYPQEQQIALATLCTDLIGRYNIPQQGIVAHRWLTPGRKIDPTDWTDENLNYWIATLYSFKGENIPIEHIRPSDGWYRCKWPATVRTAPSTSQGRIVATFAVDSHVLVKWGEGQGVRGSHWWAHLSESQLGFIHSSALELVEGVE